MLLQILILERVYMYYLHAGTLLELSKGTYTVCCGLYENPGFWQMLSVMTGFTVCVCIASECSCRTSIMIQNGQHCMHKGCNSLRKRNFCIYGTVFRRETLTAAHNMQHSFLHLPYPPHKFLHIVWGAMCNNGEGYGIVAIGISRN